VPESSKLALQMDGAKLVDAVLARTTNLLTPSADASFQFVRGVPTIVPGAAGTTLDPDALSAAVAAATAADDRTAHVELVASDPSQSTAALEALGIKEIVSEFSTPLTSEPRRTRNIANGAEKVTGTLVLPGETFSLEKALGPITPENGYITAGVIVNGEHQEGLGGGLSQMATTSFNAGYFAGFEDIEHRPHSEWFARYPEGREATIFTGTLDMKWKNTSPYGALLYSWVADGRLHVRIWGTKYWTVESTTSPRTNVKRPTTVYSQSKTCTPSSAGNPGFGVTVTRKLFLNGELKETTAKSWRYKPQNKVVCGKAPKG
jgi:vancomycin resistance protein YoaR